MFDPQGLSRLLTNADRASLRGETYVPSSHTFDPSTDVTMYDLGGAGLAGGANLAISGLGFVATIATGGGVTDADTAPLREAVDNLAGALGVKTETAAYEFTKDATELVLGLAAAAKGSGKTNPGGESAKDISTRPKGVPEDWVEAPSKKGGGVKYTNTDNPHESVRTMPGNPDSPNPAQQKPYVKRMDSGSAVDVDGNPVPPSSAEAHIPADQFEYKPPVKKDSPIEVENNDS